MTAAEMDIVIGAEVNGAVNGLKQVNTQLVKTEQTADKFTKKAGRDFTGLSRVIQDLPYGFNAISNNLTQLLPAAGAAGLAFSAIVSAITLLQIGFGAWTMGLGENKKALKENAEAVKELQANAGKEIATLTTLTNAAKNTNLSMTERLAAVRGLREEFPAYFKDLKTEEILNGNVAAAIQATSKAIFQRALIRQKESELGPIAGKIFDLEQQRQELEKQTVAIKRLNFEASKNRSRTGIIASLTGAGSNDKRSLATIAQQIAAIDKELLPLKGQFKGLAQAIIDASEAAGKGVFSEDFKEKVVKAKDTTSEYEKSVRELFKTIASGSRLLRSEVLNKPYEPLQITGGVFTLSELQAEAAIIKARNLLNKAGKKVFNAQGILTDVQFLNDAEVLTAAEKLKVQLAIIAGVIKDTLTNVLSGIGESLGNALSGAKNPFAPILAVLSEGLKSLGKAYIQIGIEAAIATKALKLLISNPYLTIAAGIALVALGQVLQAKAQNVKAFATGGVVTSPTLALVGERGPERITPLGYENSASNMGIGVVQFELQGEKLYGVLKRYEKSRLNTF